MLQLWQVIMSLDSFCDLAHNAVADAGVSNRVCYQMASVEVSSFRRGLKTGDGGIRTHGRIRPVC